MNYMVNGYGGHLENHMIPNYYTPMTFEQQMAQQSQVNGYWDAYQNHYRPSMPAIPEEPLPMPPNAYKLPDPMLDDEALLAPPYRIRCQVVYPQAGYELAEWQPVCESRQVWEPLDFNHRYLDPSSPCPPAPPGFEHIAIGKRSLSRRSRHLLGEQISYKLDPGYKTPIPMEMPDRELREYLHFIGNHDTHLSNRQSQLRVINGATGDGYYVRLASKVAPNVPKVVEPPKYQSVYQPNVSYWDLLGRNQHKAKDDQKMNEEPIQEPQPQIYNEMPPMDNNQNVYAEQLPHKADSSSCDNVRPMVNPDRIQFGTVTPEMAGLMDDYTFNDVQMF
ncbi:uncharacterized protein LOC115564878 [Drosophila navojoa]|nr:uncharacterized protein LOC115564878 [Drosophila navojoa]